MSKHTTIAMSRELQGQALDLGYNVSRLVNKLLREYLTKEHGVNFESDQNAA